MLCVMHGADFSMLLRWRASTEPPARIFSCTCAMRFVSESIACSRAITFFLAPRTVFSPGTGGRFPVFGQPIGLFVGLMMGLIGDGCDALQLQPPALGQKDDLMPALFDQPGEQFAILAGHVLMDKKEFHEGAIPWLYSGLMLAGEWAWVQAGSERAYPGLPWLRHGCVMARPGFLAKQSWVRFPAWSICFGLCLREGNMSKVTG